MKRQLTKTLCQAGIALLLVFGVIQAASAQQICIVSGDQIRETTANGYTHEL